MKRIVFAIALLIGLASSAFAQTGSPMSTSALTSQINSLFPDNTTGIITPNALRTVTLDIINSFPNTPTTANIIASPVTIQEPSPSTSLGNPTLTLGSTAGWPISLYSFNGSVNTLSVVDQQGVGAIAAASRSSDWNSALALNSIATSVLSVNDKTSTGPTGVWGSYMQSNKTASAAAIEQFIAEWSFQNLGSAVYEDPFTVDPSGSTHGLRIDSGLGTSAGNSVSSALEILNNGRTFEAGLVIGSGSVAAAAPGGNIGAIEMATNNSILWFGGASTLEGVLTVDNTATFQMSGTGGIHINGPLQATAVAFASLPSCASGTEGTLRGITDSTTNTWGGTIAGSSTNHVLAYCDGTNWTVAGK